MGKRFYSTNRLPLPLIDSIQESLPIKVYPNAETFKVVLLDENKGKAGIYRRVNLTNNKSYIGSAISLK